MKQLLLVLLFVCFIASASLAQLKVRTDGSVKIGSGIGSPDAGSLQVVENGKTTEMRIFATSANIARLWALNSVYGFSFGVDASGIGRISGNINSPVDLISFNSSASVGINYNPGTTYKLYVGGSAYCTGVWQASDMNLKRDIRPIDGALEKLMKINGRSYYYTNTKENNDFKGTGSNRKYYGFIAQEIRDVFPDLVQEVDDSCKTLAINYDGFIPLLVEAFKKQQSTIDRLENEISFLKMTNITNNISPNNELNSSKLFQNSPNPFHIETQIEYFIPNGSNGMLNIYNLQGVQIKSFTLTEKGKSKIIINGSTLNPGIYLYSLIIDGRIIDTKQMVLTD